MKFLSVLIFALLLIIHVNSQPIDESSDEEFAQRMKSTRALADCTNWYGREPEASVHLAKILSAPCSIPPTFPPNLKDGWTTDPGCDAKKQPNTCSYHVGAWGCYRHSFKNTGPGAQACYDRKGNWLSDTWQGAGTLDAETALGSIFQQLRHYTADVVPYDNCCTTSGLPQPSTCNLYFEKRPTGICEVKPAV
ncbi:unnamed protein product [Rotaria magnacalcarata]|uniref:AMOP domain-containing protein n=1 Tax=Rotaria magnacalcarata TaxID=392030 RepID=A0A816Y7U5_9BILA|nr:unnamed protein product [Rotaria magnacalcarata]CAF4412382.1 unnamed protein product [Rotaria magnacalcarata]